MSAQIHQYTAIDPTNEVEAILDFAEQGYPEELRILLTAAVTGATAMLLDEQTRHRAIAACREGDHDTIGRMVIDQIVPRLRQAALERLEEVYA